MGTCVNVFQAYTRAASTVNLCGTPSSGNASSGAIWMAPLAAALRRSGSRNTTSPAPAGTKPSTALMAPAQHFFTNSRRSSPAPGGVVSGIAFAFVLRGENSRRRAKGNGENSCRETSEELPQLVDHATGVLQPPTEHRRQIHAGREQRKAKQQHEHVAEEDHDRRKQIALAGDIGLPSLERLCRERDVERSEE